MGSKPDKQKIAEGIEYYMDGVSMNGHLSVLIDLAQAYLSNELFMGVEEIAKILLDTCEKELNESIGFMLTDNDARIFAKALSGKIPAKVSE
jgi:hypothetical protein